uniref:Uncharacterized protein n=1 Tax=Branchiostoma floridae TaxID=7739 RepID=C3Y850_BRAFL|eukprot:XP_002607509.1 hypothetical protein BRAFLDRAFT_69940 [Branchiostoma floridae]
MSMNQVREHGRYCPVALTCKSKSLRMFGHGAKNVNFLRERGGVEPQPEPGSMAASLSPHIDHLKSLCRLCGSKLLTSAERQRNIKPLLCIDFQDRICNTFGIDVGADRTHRHPPLLLVVSNAVTSANRTEPLREWEDNMLSPMMRRKIASAQDKQNIELPTGGQQDDHRSTALAAAIYAVFRSPGSADSCTYWQSDSQWGLVAVRYGLANNLKNRYNLKKRWTRNTGNVQERFTLHGPREDPGTGGKTPSNPGATSEDTNLQQSPRRQNQHGPREVPGTGGKAPSNPGAKSEDTSLQQSSRDQTQLLKRCTEFLTSHRNHEKTPANEVPRFVREIQATSKWKALYSEDEFFKKRKPAASHILVIMVSDEDRKNEPYAFPIQFGPCSSLKDHYVRDLTDCEATHYKAWLLPTGKLDKLDTLERKLDWLTDKVKKPKSKGTPSAARSRSAPPSTPGTGRGDLQSPSGRGDLQSPSGRGDLQSPSGRGDLQSPSGRGDLQSPSGRGDLQSLLLHIVKKLFNPKTVLVNHLLCMRNPSTNNLVTDSRELWNMSFQRRTIQLRRLHSYPFNDIYNMDETPMMFDLPSNYTGKKDCKMPGRGNNRRLYLVDPGTTTGPRRESRTQVEADGRVFNICVLRTDNEVQLRGKIREAFGQADHILRDGEWQYLKVVGNNNLQPIFGRVGARRLLQLASPANTNVYIY